jgi:1L-myo-inositol 1-phosphate cytidylyltransferase
MIAARGSTSEPGGARITEAVILMAGSGSRLRGENETALKPLILIRGRPLISYTIEALLGAGIKTINAVIGFEGERVRAGLQPLVPSGVSLRFIENAEWRKQNGISLLAAAEYVKAPFVLTMADHLFDRAIIDQLIASADVSLLNVAIDKKLKSIFDIDDAMKVQTRGDRIVAIGKDLQDYDAIDTGLFVCPVEFFDFAKRAKQNGDCSLADGVRLMAAADIVRGFDIGDAWWQDVDTPEMLAFAGEHLRLQAGSGGIASSQPRSGVQG